MIEPIPRLGDTIDDYCPRCRLLLNHAVASLVDNKVVKVICRTCHSEHPYRHAEIPVKKKPSPRAALFEQVLVKTTSAPETSPDCVTLIASREHKILCRGQKTNERTRGRQDSQPHFYPSFLSSIFSNLHHYWP